MNHEFLRPGTDVAHKKCKNCGLISFGAGNFTFIEATINGIFRGKKIDADTLPCTKDEEIFRVHKNMILWMDE